MSIRPGNPLTTALAILVFATAAGAAPRVSLHRYIRRSAHAGAAVRQDAVRFTGRRIEIPVVAVQPGKPDTSYEVHGQVDPTLIVPAGAKLRFLLANADGGMAHGLDVTLRAPPYPAKPALPLFPSRTDRKTTLAGTGVVPPRQGDSGTANIRKSGWFRLDPGTYYYACPVPGHAHKGMYGKLVVRCR